MTTTDGQVWSAPLDMKSPIVPDHGPQPTKSGRLIISGNIAFPYTDDPSGLAGWQMTGIYPDDMAATVFDDSEAFWKVQALMGWSAGCAKARSTRRMMACSTCCCAPPVPAIAGKLWVTESRDDGTTWSPPVETGFTDNNTKFHFGRLPDGRFYYVGLPRPEATRARNPLVLSLLTTALRFDRHFILAMRSTSSGALASKGGLYGYPHTMIHDGYLYAIVSLRKEAVAVLRVALSAF